jgi:hypothetical protein
MIFNIGPKECWTVELEKVSRRGLISLVEQMFFVHQYDTQRRLAAVSSARSQGRLLDSIAACDRFLADPKKATSESIRRSASAKKSVRRRKLEAKKASRA